jgi:hypothetical protein
MTWRSVAYQLRWHWWRFRHPYGPNAMEDRAPAWFRDYCDKQDAAAKNRPVRGAQ